MIHAMNRAEAGATKVTGITDRLIDLIPIVIPGGPQLKRALKKGTLALAEWEVGKKLYRIGGTPK